MKGVQSDMLKGTARTRARVFAMSVLPTPEGPRRSMLAFSRVSGDVSRIGAAPKLEGGGFRGMACWWPGNSS